MELSNFTLKELKQMIKSYNLHTKIAGAHSLRKAELVEELSKHLEIVNGNVVIKNIEAVIRSNVTPMIAKKIVAKKVIAKKVAPKKASLTFIPSSSSDFDEPAIDWFKDHVKQELVKLKSKMKELTSGHYTHDATYKTELGNLKGHIKDNEVLLSTLNYDPERPIVKMVQPEGMSRSDFSVYQMKEIIKALQHYWVRNMAHIRRDTEQKDIPNHPIRQRINEYEQILDHWYAPQAPNPDRWDPDSYQGLIDTDDIDNNVMKKKQKDKKKV